MHRSICKDAAYQLSHTSALFSEWIGEPAEPAHLTEDLVSRWVQQLEPTYAQRTVATQRGNLLCIWRHIAENKAAPWPGRVRRARMPEPQPIAWTLAELRLMVIAAEQAPGRLPNGIELCTYLTALIRAAYETGLRRSDLWTLRRSQIQNDGIITMRQHKTGSPHEPQLRQATMTSVLSLPGDRPLSWPSTRHAFYSAWKRHITKAAGVRHGVLQQLRRTGATIMERTNPEATSRYLGHKTPNMKRYYVDRSQAYGPAPQPPPL